MEEEKTTTEQPKTQNDTDTKIDLDVLDKRLRDLNNKIIKSEAEIMEELAILALIYQEQTGGKYE